MGRGVGIGSYIIFSWGISNFQENFLIKMCRKTRISSRANSFPRHIRGPPPNGTYVYGAGPAP